MMFLSERNLVISISCSRLSIFFDLFVYILFSRPSYYLASLRAFTYMFYDTQSFNDFLYCIFFLHGSYFMYSKHKNINNSPYFSNRKFLYIVYASYVFTWCFLQLSISNHLEHIKCQNMTKFLFLFYRHIFWYYVFIFKVNFIQFPCCNVACTYSYKGIFKMWVTIWVM